MQSARWIPAAERGCLAILLLWLLWLPLPFGSVDDSVRIPLIAVPLVVCAVASIVRLYATREHSRGNHPTRAFVIWTNGALVFLTLAALQLLPLPPPVLSVLSPESHFIWSAASRIAKLAGVPAPSFFSITVDARATALEFFRLVSLLAAFVASALLVRSQDRRKALALVLCGAAAFEALYGLREAALQRFEIWGWVNKLIFNRVTGTFVNPNHFAHYLAIVLPLGLFLIASKWHVTGTNETPLSMRLMNLLTQGVLTTSFAIVTVFFAVAGILVAQSRGALLALGVGILAMAALIPGKRLTRIAFAGAAGVVLVVALVMFLGTERTVARFVPNQFERETLVGRRIGISAGLGVWKRFSVFGSGVGTFERVVSIEQEQDLLKVYQHAHNDYIEIAATAGTLGIVIVLVTFLGGYVNLARITFSERAAELSWRRRAYQAAALTSITIAAVHSLFDFNFFIPSNPATLAAIAGAAVATLDSDKRTRR